jgi:hypothetical protein
MNGRRLLFFLAIVTALPTLASEPLAIQDNSFLIEEAYNQEAGVVQHIFTYMRSRGGTYASTFTQEWPVRGLTHQLSYTLPVQRRRGDALINYRRHGRPWLRRQRAGQRRHQRPLRHALERGGNEHRAHDDVERRRQRDRRAAAQGPPDAGDALDAQ